MSELKVMWKTILEAYPYAVADMQAASQPSDGQPVSKNTDPKAPCNIFALSWVEQTDRIAALWAGEPKPVAWLAQYAHVLFDRLGPDDQLNFQTETHSLHTAALSWLPAHVRTARIKAAEVADVYARTIEELSFALKAMGHPVAIGTLHKWTQRGHLPKTDYGYSLATALEKAKP